jgi:WD40 repeat protein
MPTSPFKFLDSYTKDDRDIFFGRDNEIEELYQRIFESKLLLVYGVSGTGKSSLINCGLANKFQDTDWLPVMIRRGGNIIESMSAGIRNASLTLQQNRFFNPVDFKKVVRSLYLDYYKPVFFIFDQFEELFIFGDKEERKEFIQIIKLLIDSDLQCRFIFVIREEYMAGVTEFEKYIPDFFNNRVRIEKMSHLNALEAINGPCKAFKIILEEGFAEALLEKLSPGSEDVDLTYLQVFLDKVFRLAQDKKEAGKVIEHVSFNIQLLENTGNVSDLLGSFLDDQISLMQDPDTAMTVLKAFVSDKGTKRPASEQEATDNICSFGKVVSPERTKELILNFVKLMILRDKDDNGRYELRHDSLAEKVYDKFTTSEKDLLEVRQFIENSYQSHLKRKIILSNDDLNYISNKDALLNLNADLKKFIEDSRKHQKAKSKTVRSLVVISAIAFIMLLSTIVYYIVRKTKMTESVFLKESISQYNRPIDQLCLAGASWKSYKGEEAREALLKSFNNLIRNPGTDENFIKLRKEYLTEFKPVSSSIEFANCSKDNRFLYGYSSDSVFIWNKNGELRSRFSHGTSHLVTLLMSDDGENLGAVNTDTILTVWDIEGNIRFTRKAGYNSVNCDQIFRFTGNNMLIAISDNKDADLIDINGNVIQSFKNHKGRVNAVDLSNDGKFMATASSDKTINVWYLNSNLNRFDLYNTITSHSDTVWSIDFAPNNRYLLSTSADRRVVVTSINNKEAISFGDNFQGAFSNEISLGYPFYAEFDGSGTGIAVRSSELKNKKDKDYWIAIYVDIYYNLAQSGEINRFDYVRFSPEKKYLAYASGDDVSLISRLIFRHTDYALFNNYRLLQISGQKPFFSSDGKNIYTISGNQLESWFIDIETISQIAIDYYKNWHKYF